MKNYMDKKNYRYERKFMTKDLSLGEVEEIIKSHPSIFSEKFFERKINNIYLDSENLTSFLDNMQGVSVRCKVRIRWYGKTFGKINEPVLELKNKENLLGGKISFKLKPFSLDKNFSLNFLMEKVFKKSKIDLRILEHLKTLKPILLNSYKRRYFLSSNKKFRITIDGDLKFFRLKNKMNNFLEKFFDKELIITELKYSQEDDSFASGICMYLPFRVTAMSKYVYGINMLEIF